MTRDTYVHVRDCTLHPYRNQLLTNIMFDYEDIKQYRVRLYVTDLGHLLDNDNSSSSGMNPFETVLDLPADHVDFVDITVSVIDENDERPVFVGGATSYSFNVMEEEPNGTYVGTVEVRGRRGRIN